MAGLVNLACLKADLETESRTLQRQLQAEGTSYQTVLSDTRVNSLLELWNGCPACSLSTRTCQACRWP